MNKNPVPVREKEQYEVEVIGIGKLGDPIAKIHGFAVILRDSNAQRGDLVTVKITTVYDKYAYAKEVNK